MYWELFTWVFRDTKNQTCFALRGKCPHTEFFLVRIFRHSGWMRRDNSYLSVFSSNVGKYGPEKTPYLDTFHAMVGTFIRLFRWKLTQKCLMLLSSIEMFRSPITWIFSNFEVRKSLLLPLLFKCNFFVPRWCSSKLQLSIKPISFCLQKFFILAFTSFRCLSKLVFFFSNNYIRENKFSSRW